MKPPSPSVRMVRRRACGDGCADGSAEAVAHGGEAFVVDDALAAFLGEGLHHDGVGAAAGAGDDDVVCGGERGEFFYEDVGREEAGAGVVDGFDEWEGGFYFAAEGEPFGVVAEVGGGEWRGAPDWRLRRLG